jgi:hypothetical protein
MRRVWRERGCKHADLVQGDTSGFVHVTVELIVSDPGERSSDVHDVFWMRLLVAADGRGSAGLSPMVTVRRRYQRRQPSRGY